VRLFLMISSLLLILLFISFNTAFAIDSPLLQKINDDFDSGEISYGQSLYYRLMSVRAPWNLPEQYAFEGEIIDRSATPIFLELIRNMDKLSTTELDRLEQFRNRPSATDTYDSPLGMFKVHYNIEGVNAVTLDDIDPANGIPDYVDMVAKYIDSAWQYQNVDQGYLLPPSDNDAGGDNRYDIYLLDVPYYGYVQPEATGPEAWDDYISYMVIHNNFFGFPDNQDPMGNQIGAIKVTCAHEYFHAVQYAYTYLADIWFMEVSSTWMEDICYPEVNDNYNYLDSFFLYPHHQLNNTDNWHHYGEFVWNRFLDNYYDTTLIRNIWEDLSFTPDAYFTIDANLQDYGSDLSSTFSEFSLWNWCTSYRDDGDHYEDGSDYPLIEIASEVTFYPTSWLVPPANQLPAGLSSNYICFYNPDEVIGDLVIWFEGNGLYEWDANLILAGSDNEYLYEQIPLNSAAVGSLIVTDIELYDYVMLNPVVKSWYADSANYQYSADLIPLTPFAVEVVEDGPHTCIIIR